MAKLKIIFNGTEYLIKDTKLQDAIAEMHVQLAFLEGRPGLYQNRKLVESWDSLVSSGKIVVNDGCAERGFVVVGDMPPKNQYGFYFDMPYGAWDGAEWQFVFHEDGSFEFIQGGYPYEYPAGSAIYGDGSIDLSGTNHSPLAMTVEEDGAILVGNIYDVYFSMLLETEPVNISGDLVFPDDGSVTSIGDFSGCDLTSVVIPDSAKYIESYAFGNCYNLTTVDLGDGVTSIGDYAFEECANLNTLTIPNSVYSIGYSAFQRCDGLRSVTIGTGVTDIESNAFYDCSNIIEVINYSSLNIEAGSSEYGSIAANALEVHSEDNSKIITTDEGLEWYVSNNGSYLLNYPGTETEIVLPDSINGLPYAIGPYIFNGREDITSITLPEGCIGICDYAFYNCTGLTEIVIPASVANIGNYAFYGCTGLTELDFPDSVINIGDYAFYKCTGLTELDLPDSVINIGEYAFYGCSGFTEISLSNNLTTIGERAFYNCSNVTELRIPSSVTSIGATAFRGCSKLEKVHTSDVAAWCNINFGASASPVYENDSALLYINNELPTEIVIPDSVNQIPNFAFAKCNTLTNITIPDSVTSIGGSAFSGCTALTDITIPDSVTSVGGNAFDKCIGLTEIVIPNSVTSMGMCPLKACSGLTDVTVPFLGMTAINTTNLAYCLLGSLFGGNFTGSTSVTQYYDYGRTTTWYIPSGLKNVTVNGGQIPIGAFSGCSMLESITLGNDVTAVGAMAFQNCTGLTKLIMSKAITALSSSSLSSCTSLIELTIPFVGESPTATTLSEKTVFGYLFGSSAPSGTTTVTQYYNNYNTTYKNYSIPSSLRKVSVLGGNIPYGAFYNCSMLEEIGLGEGVTNIGQHAFRGCTGLTSITFEGTIDQWNTITKQNEWNYNVPVTEVVCSDGSVTL
jgi:hypothetical protein